MTTINATTYPIIESWIGREKECNQKTFEKINGRLTFLYGKLGTLHKSSAAGVVAELASDVKALEKTLVGKVAKLSQREKEELKPLMQRTRECLQQLSDNKDLIYCSAFPKSHPPTKSLYTEKYNVRRAIHGLQLQLYSSDFECVKSYAERLSHYPEKIQENALAHKYVAYESQNLEFDLTAYLPILLGRVKSLNRSEIDTLKPLLSCAYAALEKIKMDPTLKGNFESAVTYLKKYDKGLEEGGFVAVEGLSKVQSHLQSQTGASLDLYRMHGFAALFSSSFRGYVVLKCDGVGKTVGANVELCKTVTEEDQEQVRSYLESIRLALLVESTVKHMTTVDLMKMKITCGYLLANYERAMVNSVPLTKSIFDKLVQINDNINKCLESRKSEVGEAVGETTISAAMYEMLHHLRNNTYFDAFWTESKHVEQLQDLFGCVKVFNKAIKDSGELSIKDLTFIGAVENEEVGIRVYEKNPKGEKRTEEKEIVVFCSETEKSKHYWNIFQQREVSEFGVVGHDPVIGKAEHAIKALWEIFEEKETSASKKPKVDISKIKELTFAGFGLDGAVAQLLGYSMAQELEGHGGQVFVYGLGTPAYLNSNSAAKVTKQGNLYSLNFALLGDKNLKTNYKFLSFFQDKWAPWSFITYNLYNDFWEVTDFTGHNPDNYFANVKTAIEMPTMLHKIYRETDDLLHKKH